MPEPALLACHAERSEESTCLPGHDPTHRFFAALSMTGPTYSSGIKHYPPLYPITPVVPGVDPRKLKNNPRSATTGSVGPVPPLVGNDCTTMEVSSGSTPCELAGTKRKLLALTTDTLMAGILTVICERKRVPPRVTKKVTAALAGVLLGLKSVMVSAKLLPRCPSAKL